MSRDRSTVCPMDGILQLLSGPWTTYILWQLRTAGGLRFGQLKALMPTISSKVLTERLRMLETAGLLHRDYRPTVPPAVTYSLTPRGDELKTVLDDLARLGGKWHEEDAAREAGMAPAASARSAPRPLIAA